MDFKPWYPQDFIRTLSNTLTEKKVSQWLKKPGSSPRFVYGVLMLPAVLKYYIDEDAAVQIEQSMTQATLFGYKLYQLAESSPPAIAQSSDLGATVDGILVFNLTDRQRNSIYELEGGVDESRQCSGRDLSEGLSWDAPVAVCRGRDVYMAEYQGGTGCYEDCGVGIGGVPEQFVL